MYPGKTDCLVLDKEHSRLRTMQLYPSADLRLKTHYGRAAALLLATYGMRIVGRGESPVQPAQDGAAAAIGRRRRGRDPPLQEG
jgi:hypothetical protein